MLDFQDFDARRNPKANLATVFSAFADDRSHVAFELEDVTLRVEYVLGRNPEHGTLLPSIYFYRKDGLPCRHVVLEKLHTGDSVIL